MSNKILSSIHFVRKAESFGLGFFQNAFDKLKDAVEVLDLQNFTLDKLTNGQFSVQLKAFVVLIAEDAVLVLILLCLVCYLCGKSSQCLNKIMSGFVMVLG